MIAMKQIAVPIFALSLIASPALAQEDAPSLMERGARLFFEGLMQEMEPALDEVEGLAKDLVPLMQELSGEMGQAFADLLDQVEDWAAYHPPEILPNGDIILRKKTPQEMQQEPATPNEIEL
jgi:hypothetical protein